MVKDETGRFSGESFVILNTKQSALGVISMHKQPFGESGRWIECQKADREIMESIAGNQFEWDGVIKVVGIGGRSK